MLDRITVVAEERGHLALHRQILGEIALLIAQRKRLRGGEIDASGDRQLAGGDRPLEADIVEIDAGIVDSGTLGDAGADGLRIGHLRNLARRDERGELDRPHPGFGERLDETDLVRRRDLVGLADAFELEALARAAFDERHPARQCHVSLHPLAGASHSLTAIAAPGDCRVRQRRQRRGRPALKRPRSP